MEKVRVELVEIERGITAVETAQATVRHEADAAHEELSAHEIKLAENRQRAQFLTEEVTREFQADVATLDWKHQLWHADDEPEGLKPLDLDEEEDEAGGQEATKRRRRPKAPKGAPTETDLVALDATDLAMLLDGIDLEHVKRPKMWVPQPRAAAG